MSSTEKVLPVSIPDISGISSAFADPTRAAVCGALMRGTAWTPSELAEFCSVSRSTMSEHLALLKNMGIISELKQGRHRYMRLANPEVASTIESLAALTGLRFRSSRSLRASHANRDFIAARTCYSHLAGELGVSLLQQLNVQGYMSPYFQLTESGCELMNAWGISNPERLEGKPCMDTTQRVFHLAGSLGTAICTRWFTLGWVERRNSSRCVQLASAGREALATHGIVLA